MEIPLASGDALIVVDMRNDFLPQILSTIDAVSAYPVAISQSLQALATQVEKENAGLGAR